MNNTLPLGKLSNTLLKELIATLPKPGKEIVIPPGVGFDAAGLKLGERLYSITTDPVTFATDRLGTFSVAININDIACLGCRPKYYSACLLLPEGTTEATLRAIWQDLAAQLKHYQILSVGGHAEVTTAVNTPIIAAQMIGEVVGDRLLNLKDAKAGDKILLWQHIAIEGTAIIAREQHEDLLAHFTPTELQTMMNLVDDPGICVWPFVEKLLPSTGVIALHDPTEGGIATALHEVADATQCGIMIDRTAIPILSYTQQLAALYNLDPLGLLASGALLIICKADAVKPLQQRFPQALVEIGELTSNNDRLLKQGSTFSDLPRYCTDEIIKALN